VAAGPVQKTSFHRAAQVILSGGHDQSKLQFEGELSHRLQSVNTSALSNLQVILTV
jgi:hypothetical protein